MGKVFDGDKADLYRDLLAHLQSVFKQRIHHIPASFPHHLQLADLTLKDIQTIGLQLALQAKTYSEQTWIFAFDGDMGTGKTALIKAIAQGLGYGEQEVQSPTFSLLAILQGVPTLFHFDLYRLKTADDFENLGFQEYFEYPGICCIEWAQKIEFHQSLRHHPHLNFALQFGRQQHLRNIDISLNNHR